ncbi:bifunctional aspartate kinase/homoserine dehydrogenase I [Candidatus Kaiserbacteria bacterium RIFCSPLOWO2_12_FULL_53_8]|uniref:Bifunctional aspartate kinase/homoserine dehydrogenase I n=2 Tax=Candidatus Kaiseribacteriota TaxID=1752734 RepID=A0A1F6CVT2_9BACT|nr:MAG: bifunctional aspartate kinase/homoserine dehydrogenase I [Candidatus Kaiserbacteria bacterium RIFCSPHIGHO2_01_FULL_53_29]OGG92017.1 MAG: bifunctional aspartate kinase/homoserine dehydrogenase I [Candidatus Kaiserbacteria bacterium RIFCSPLOWO2_12_FULL_53_8]
MKGVKVLKFGGTSMGSVGSIRQVIAIIKKPSREARTAAVVVSAMSGVTDQLIDIARRAAAKDHSYKKLIRNIEKRHIVAIEKLVGKRRREEALANVRILIDSLEGVAHGIFLVRELSAGALDYIMSYGERLSAHLLTDALNDRGIKAEYLNARNIITTDENFGKAAVDFKTTNRSVRAYFRKHPRLQVVTGFIASTAGKATTTLGRGGSDYSASIVGAALNAHAIEIWTDVSGVMTADPRKVKDALPVASMSYLEAAEISYFGAKVIHPPTMRPAMERTIPIYIKNTFQPEAAGTVVGKRSVSETQIKGITSINDVAVIQVEGNGMVNVRGASGRLFGSLARANVNVVMITQASSQHSISLAVSRADSERARDVIEEEFVIERHAHLVDPVRIEHDLSILAIVGEGMKERRGIAGRFFQTLARNGVNIVAIAQGSSELNISVVVQKNDAVKALNAVHAAFFAPERKVLNIFLVGTGVVGGALLNQMTQLEASLEREHGFVVRLVGLANGKLMAFDEEGIPPSGWKKSLDASQMRMNIRDFIETMKRMEMPNSVFVDCTASESVATEYLEILKGGISIVTPSKCANSGSYQRYSALKAAAAKYGVKFLYETNVGAGLPVLSTLRDLLLSGDRVRKIEAVLSGTLNYIFDDFFASSKGGSSSGGQDGSASPGKGVRRFSDIVQDARAKGFTEPDPRNDLSGLDVARKILILAREMGYPLELKDVKVESLLTDRARKAKSVEKFFEVLRKDDGWYEKKKRTASNRGKVLRYVAIFNKGRATVSLQAVDSSHPFYALYGNDNVIAFFTDRYKASPLIVQGPGAGADVTAAGVFADILRTAVNAI